MELRRDHAFELGLTQEDLEWFVHFAHPERWDADTCVLWDGSFWREYPDLGCNGNQDHGVFLWGKCDWMTANRLSYELYRGNVAQGLYALHKCPGKTNKTRGRCVNALHIEPGTRTENLLDQWTDRGVDVMQCFRERRTLTSRQRRQKYNVSQGFLAALDTGEHPFTRDRVKVIDV